MDSIASGGGGGTVYMVMDSDLGLCRFVELCTYDKDFKRMDRQHLDHVQDFVLKF